MAEDNRFKRTLGHFSFPLYYKTIHASKENKTAVRNRKPRIILCHSLMVWPNKLKELINKHRQRKIYGNLTSYA